MNKKITGIFVCTLLISIFFSPSTLINATNLTYEKINDQCIISYSNNNDIKNFNFDGEGTAVSDDPVWFIERVEDQNMRLIPCSIAIDSDNNPHIVFFDEDGDDLKYGKRVDETWQFEIISSNGHRCADIALDSNDHAHICWYDDDNYDLKYAKWNITENSWDYDTVESSSYGKVGEFCSIALDNADIPHISFYNYYNERSLMYAKWNPISSDWDTVKIDKSRVGLYTSIAVDSNNNPHISYYHWGNDELKYAKWNGNNWVITRVKEDVLIQGDTSLVLDNNGHAHISYWDLDKKRVQYATNSYGNGWEIIDFDPDGDFFWSSSIAMNWIGDIHISYATQQGALKCAVFDGLSWSILIVDHGNYNAMALDNNEIPHMIYRNFDDVSWLWYAKKINTPPNPPSKPSGPSSGRTETFYIFSTSTTDPTNDKIKYGWDWGDESPIEWSDFKSSGSSDSRNHMWYSPGTYNIRVISEDIHGDQSIWSESLDVTITTPPILQTLDATWVGSTSANLNGMLFDDGGEPCQIRFRYKKSSSGSWSYPSDWEGAYTSGQTFSQTVTSLTPSTQYDFAAGAKNSGGGGEWGNTEHFTTNPNQPPDKPNPPNCPDYCKPGGIYPFTVYANDENGDMLSFQFKFEGILPNGNTTTIESQLYGWYESNTQVTFDVEIPQDFVADQHIETCVRANDGNSYSPYSEETTIYLSNPPDIPIITGPGNGEIGETYDYTIVAHEPDSEEIFYYVDWGDDTNSGWVGSYNSDQPCNISHEWDNQGTYTIKAKAKDKWGIESDWGELEVTMPRNKQSIRLLYSQFLESL